MHTTKRSARLGLVRVRSERTLTVSEPSDETLMNSVCRGDRDAFSILVHRHIDSLYGYALRLCHSPATADDLVQDTWLAAWQNAARYKPGKSRLTTWLHRILHNRFIDTTRRKQPDYDQDVVDDAIDPDTGSRVEANQTLHRQLNHLIDALPQNQKAAVALTHVQGFSNSEVAHILGLSVRATESLLARARATLRRQLQELGY